ncbi:MAG: type II toxin-antitoxin system RatA family toxin [Thiohalophilus sp.]
MANYRERRHFPYARQDLFGLVADVERYPEFLPGWLEVNVMDAEVNHKRVHQVFGMGPVRIDFLSQADFSPPETIHIHSDDNPFQILDINWQFAAVGEHTTEVSLNITVELRPIIFQQHLESWFSKSASLILAAFERRAATLYPDTPQTQA